MKPSGVIYQSSNKPTGELRVSLTESEQKHFKFMRFIGVNMSSLALAFVVFFYGPTLELDLNYQAGLAKVGDSAAAVEEPKAAAEAITQKEEFTLYIPAIGASANVIKDVNPFDEAVYHEALKQGIAHAANTARPGENGRVYLFAHSTSSPASFSEYNAIFYQLRLLNQGDRIFVNYNGSSYLYIVKAKVVVGANDTHWLTGESAEEELLLQTCDPPGTSLRRLLVIAQPIDKN